MRILVSIILAGVLAVAAAPAVLADSCCGEHPDLVARPSVATPGMAVTFAHISCTGLGDPPPKLSSLRRYLLTTDSIADVTNNLDASSWSQFKEIVAPDSTTGGARIVVPELPDGDYFLWWTCETAPGVFAYHYAPEAVLTIAATLPPTDTDTVQRSADRGQPDPRLALLAGVAAAVAVLCRLRSRPSLTSRRQGSGPGSGRKGT
jgi:hypothetical protein